MAIISINFSGADISCTNFLKAPRVVSSKGSNNLAPKTCIKITISLLFKIFLLNVSTVASAQDLTRYVQPFSGTAPSTTIASLKHGGGTELNANTIPAVTLPFAMVQWTPQTQTSENKCVPPYFYKDSLFNGFRGSHWLSGSCTQDYGSFTVMPITGRLQTAVTNYQTRFIHADEEASPNAYKVRLREYNMTAAVTGTLRCGFMEFTVEKADSLYLLITPNSDFGEGFVKIDAEKGEVWGYNPAHRIYQGWGKQAGFSGYFIIKFETAFSSKGTYSGSNIFSVDSIKNQKDIGAYVGFSLQVNEKVRIRIGTSFSSLEGARKNLAAELPTYNFEAVAQQAKAAWHTALSQITVQTSVEKDKRIFYTAMYHAMQHPRLFNDVDGTYPKFSSNYAVEKVKKGNYYDDFSMWDIYRAQLPLFEILQPQLINDFVQSLVLKGQQGGWMPIFPCWNSYTAAMIGDHTASVIASAYQKGIRNFDVNEAYRLLRQNAFDSPSNPQDYIDGKGRRALESYLKYGYIPMEDSVQEAFHKKEQVSRTLEYAYDDYAVAQLAKGLGKTADYNLLMKRAGNYKNVFDPAIGLMRGRYFNKTWVVPYHPDSKESFITEGTPRQYTFYVPHDVDGLAKIMGGKAKLEESLDSLFLNGEYWHGNEPGHQVPFMYNYTNAPWKTQEKVQNIVAEEYSDGPGGLSGNDDAGQMSAWYVFAAIGFYPVNPVSAEYALASPIFDRVTINLPGGKKFEIICHKKDKDSKHTYSAKWNGKTFTSNFFRYTDIVKGGKLELYLQSKPSKK
jgi:predicted alpha-1,2-mannosidase